MQFQYFTLRCTVTVVSFEHDLSEKELNMGNAKDKTISNNVIAHSISSKKKKKYGNLLN